MVDITKLRYYLKKIVELSPDEAGVPVSIRNLDEKSDITVINGVIDIFTLLNRNPHIRERLSVSLASNLSFEDAILDILQLLVDAAKFAKENEHDKD